MVDMGTVSGPEEEAEEEEEGQRRGKRRPLYFEKDLLKLLFMLNLK